MAYACEDIPRGYDGFPIEVDTAGGAMVAVADIDRGATPFPVVIDILSPVTTLDVGGRPQDDAGRLLVELNLHGVEPGRSIPRARFLDIPIIDAALCAAPPCLAGPAGGGRRIAGVVGADVLGLTALRIDFEQSSLTLFPDIAGTAAERGLECDAVMADPYGGGGTLVVAGTEVAYPPRRTVVGVCVGAEPAWAEAFEADLADGEAGTSLVETGVDTLFALSTAVGQSVIAASAWDRLALRLPSPPPPAAALPRGTLLLPSGAIDVGIGTVPRVALVGDLGDESDTRGPCRELHVNRFMAEDVCRRRGIEGGPCPCRGEEQRCSAAAAVEVDASLEVAVLDDGHPFLQALRDELRPGFAELDGVLGADALAGLRLDLDYPDNRLMFRCLDPMRCTARPQVLNPGDDETRAALERCREAPAPDAGPVP